MMFIINYKFIINFKLELLIQFIKVVLAVLNFYWVMRIFYSSFLKLSFYLVSKEKIFFQLEKKAKVAKQSKNDAKIAAKQSKNDAKSVSQLGIKRKALDESAVTNLNKKAKVQKIFNLAIHFFYTSFS